MAQPGALASATTINPAISDEYSKPSTNDEIPFADATIVQEDLPPASNPDYHHSGHNNTTDDPEIAVQIPSVSDQMIHNLKL